METLRDDEVLKAIAKTELTENPSKSQLLWMHKSLDDVAENCESFLIQIAGLGRRLNKKMLIRVLKNQYEGDATVIQSFANCLHESLNYCRKKRRSIRSGTKTRPAVLRICKAAYPHGAPASSDDTPPLEGTPQFEDLFGNSDVECLESSADEGKPNETAEADLAQAKRMFGPPGSPKVLAKRDSAVSIGSSAPGSPQAAAGVHTRVKVDMGCAPSRMHLEWECAHM